MSRKPSNRKGDERQQEVLVTQHMPQVRYIARQIHERLPRHVLLEDLVHAGVIGLIDALRRYDPSKEVQFKTYAKFRIRGAILDSLREMDWGPRDLRRKARQVEDAFARLGSILGRAPNERELAQELAITLQQLQETLRELGGLELGSVQVDSENGEGCDLAQQMAGPAEDNPYVHCLRKELKTYLLEAIGELSEREQQVLMLYYNQGMTMKDIGEVLGVGESRISQIHGMAVSNLRTRLSARPLISTDTVIAASGEVTSGYSAV